MGYLSVMENVFPFIILMGAFGVTYILIPVIIDVSHLKNLIDDPEDWRKLHLDHIPNLGGIAIFAAVFIVFSLSGYAMQLWSPYLAAGLTLLFFSGIKDDILVIDPYKKLFIQVIAILALVLGADQVITNLGGVFGFHEIPYWAGVGLTFFTMVVVLNAYNLIDGIDGLAAGIGVIASLFFGWWFWQVGMASQAFLSLTVAGALAAFLMYNFQPANIFMGDTGSQIVGYVLGFLAISFVQTGVEAPVEVPFRNAVPVLVLSVLIVPLYDTLRVFVIRALRGESPFKADRRHVHHQLIDMGFSHRTACYILYGYTLLIIGLTVALAEMEVNVLLGTVLMITVLLFPTMHLKREILKKIGMEMPSRRQVRHFEMKYGMPPQSPTMGPSANEGARDEADDEGEKRGFEEVPV